MEQRGGRRDATRRWIAGLLAFFAASWAFVELEPLRHRALAYETPGACQAGASGGWQPAAYVTSWDGPTFLIRATEYPNCADEVVSRVSAHVFGDRVFLRIGYHAPSGESYACHCARMVNVRLTGLEKRDYRVVPVFPP
jgi:hypothetical protein